MKPFNVLFNTKFKVGDVIICKGVLNPTCDKEDYFIIIKVSIFNPIRRLFKKPYKYKCVAIKEDQCK